MLNRPSGLLPLSSTVGILVARPMSSPRSRTLSATLYLLLALAAGLALALRAAPPAHGSAFMGAGCTVPPVTELRLTYAKSLIRKALCKVGKVHRVRSARHLKGRVLTQSPGAGRVLKKGARVNLVVGRGPRHS